MALPKANARRTLHAPEVWVIMQAFGAVRPDAEVPPEIAADAGAARKAQAAMLREGALTTDAAGKVWPAREIEALVRPAAYPEIVFVANLTGPAKSSRPPQVICFNWRRDTLVVNWVDAANDHHFEAYPPGEARNCIWDHLARQCDWDVDALKPGGAGPAAVSPEKAIEQMRQTVMLMAVNGVQAPKQTTRALGWFVGGRSAWLMQKDEQADKLVPSPAGQAEIQKAVFEFVDKALAGG